jgi:hypothetical protein
MMDINLSESNHLSYQCAGATAVAGLTSGEQLRLSQNGFSPRNQGRRARGELP